MNPLGRTLVMLTAGGLMVTGCATPVPVATHTLRCDVNGELLATRCEVPQTLPADATFETIVDVMRTDRQALLECGRTVEALRASLLRCNQQTDHLNDRIDEINDNKVSRTD